MTSQHHHWNYMLRNNLTPCGFSPHLIGQDTPDDETWHLPRTADDSWRFYKGCCVSPPTFFWGGGGGGRYTTPPYHKAVYKSHGLCAIFQLFGAASIRVRLLFEVGWYAKSRVFKTHKSSLAHVKWEWNLALRLFQNYFNCKQTVGMRKAVGFRPTSTTPGPFFELRLLFECGLSATWVRRKWGFYSSAASNQVRLLLTVTILRMLRFPSEVTLSVFGLFRRGTVCLHFDACTIRILWMGQGPSARSARNERQSLASVMNSKCFDKISSDPVGLALWVTAGVTSLANSVRARRRVGMGRGDRRLARTRSTDDLAW